MSTRYFLALDGVKGDSLNSKYKGWFEVSNFDLDLVGAGAGTAAFSPLTVTLDTNTGLAPLLALAATGKHLDGATLIGVTDVAGQAKVYQLDLADMLVTKVEQRADSITEAGPTLTLDYSKIELETFTIDGVGGSVPKGQFGFDLTANMAGITVPSADPGGSVAETPEPRDYFMLIDGLNGGSQDAQHKGWFEISGFDLDLEKLVAGNADFAPLNVTLSGDVELADLMRMAATGRDPVTGGLIRGVHIEGFTAGVNRTEVYDLTLASVAVTKVVDSEDHGYRLSLDYGKIALVTNGIDATGKPSQNGEFAYDLINNTAIAPFSLGLSPASSVGGSSPATYFLALDGVKGDLDPSFKGGAGRSWFEVNSFDFDLQGVGLPGPSGIVTKAAFSPLTLTLDSNTALAPLLAMAATGELNPPSADPRIKAATLIGVAGDGQTVLYRLDLAGPGLSLPITKVEDVAGAGVTFTLDFDRIELQTFGLDNKGAVSPAGDFKWNETAKSDNLGTMPSVESGKSAPSPEPAKYFMLINGLNGGSTDSLHKGWFEVSNFELDLKNGASLGKPNFSPLNVTLPQEAGLADVMDLAATNELVKGVRIEGITGGTTPAEVYELTLADVLVSKVADGENGGYSLSLDYGKIALTTKTQAGAQATQFTYDVAANTSAFNPSSLALSTDSSGGPVTPAKYFLALDGVKGDSLDGSHKGWFEVTNFDVDLHHLSSAVPGGAADPGKPIFSPFTLTLNSNTGLAPLLALAVTGQHLNGATLVGVTAGAQDKAYQLDLADVLVTKVEDDAGAGLTLSLDYGKIELDTFARTGAGGVVPEGQFGFDRTTNTGGVTVPSVLPSGSVDPSPQPATYFMLIDGVNGGSTNAQHKGWFEITGVDLDVTRLAAPGEANFPPLIVTPKNETGLAGVMELAATGGLVKGVHIEGVTGGGTPAKVYDLTLAEARVTKVADGEDDGYSLSLDYGKIALVTKGVDATGQPTTNGEFGFDVVKDISIPPFTLALSPDNTAPIAIADAAAVKEDTAPNPIVGNVLSNDQDTDGDTLTVTTAGTFALGHGSLALNADGSYAYTLDNSNTAVNALNDGQTLTDAFTYQISDGHGGTSSAALTVTIRGTTDTPANTPPTAVADAAAVKEDTAPNPVIGNVLTNDQDTDGDTLAVTTAGTFALGHGSLALKVDGSYAYTLDNSNPAVNALNDGQTLTDAFTYQISDGHGGTSSAALTVTIHGTTDNAGPIAIADAAAIKEDTAPNPVIGNVLTNDQDTDGDALTVSTAGTFALGHGSLALKVDGSYAYTLDNSNPAVNALNDGQTLTDAFTYQISDGHGGTSSAKLTVTINGTTDNAGPIAIADAVAIKEDTAPNPVIGNVLSNDQDTDGDTLAVTTAGTFALGHGSLALNADGSYAYTLDNSNPAVNALNDGQTLTDAFTYQISDGHGGTSSAALTVTIRGTTDTPANTPPTAVADAAAVKEDTAPNPVIGNVLTNDQDTDGDTLAVTTAGTFALGHGSLALNADGSYAYTLDNSNPAVNALNDGQTLTDAFTYQISDGHGGTSSAALTVTIHGTTDNAGPIAIADAAAIKEDTAPNPVIGNVLTNDQDTDGDTLTVTTAGTFALGHGSLALKVDGSYAYTLDNSNPAVNALNDGQTLTDAFTYQISDGHGGTSSAALTVTIHGTTDNAGPIAIADAAAIKEDTAPNPVIGNVLTNDQDTDGDTLTVTTAGTFALGHGSLALKVDGSYAYTLDNSNPAVNALNDGQTLTDAFTYQISDGHGGTSSAALTVTIRGTTDTPANTPPTAVADAAAVKEDTAPNPVIGNVLTNDQDTDGDTLAVTTAGTFALGHGSLALKVDGSYAYTLDNSNPAVNALNDGQTLTDAFTYQISDGHGGTSSAALTVTIHGTTDNAGPIAIADAAAIKEDTAPNPVIGNVLTNDQDTDGDALTVSTAGTFALGHGSLALKVDGSYAYTLDNSNPAVNALNDGQTLTDAFTYQISDGHGGTSSAKLTVTINGTTDNAGPIAIADAVAIKEDTAPNPVIGNVLSNDQDTDGDTLAVTTAGTFALGHGSLALNADGSYAYTLDNSNPAVNALNDGQTLTDAFTYQISDGHGGTSSAALTVTIRGTTDTPANTPPTAVADAAAVKEDTAPNPVIGNVLTNDQDTDGDTLAVTTAGTFALGHGSLALNADGSYAYTLDNSNPAVNALNDGQTLTDAFTYQISDGHGGTSSAALTVTIHGTTDNAGPIAIADAAAIKEDTAPNPVIGNVLTNDQDTDGDTLTVTTAGTFALGHGSLALKVDGSYAYTLDNSNPAVNALNDGQTLTDAFTYQISDGHGGTSSAALTVTIHGTTDNAGPIAIADAAAIKEDTAPNPVIGNVLTNDQDTDGDALTVSTAGTFALGHGSLALKVDGSYAYTLDNSNPAVNALNDGQTLTDAFTYQISDGHGGTSSAALTVTINGTTDVDRTISVSDVQKYYLEITRAALPNDAAVSTAALINSGMHTEFQLIKDLVELATNTTMPAIAVEATMYGAVGTSAEVDLLVKQFLPSQIANAIKYGFDPLVYASEALGLAFAFGNEAGGTAFLTDFGPGNALLPNTVIGDASFSVAAVNAIFGPAATANLNAVMNGWVANWKAFYATNGLPGIAGATADQIDLAARAAAWGDAIGVALDNDLGPLKGHAINFLMDAAQGTAGYSMSLVGQSIHQPFQGEI